MADSYGTDCGVTGMKNYLHIFIKGGLVLFLIVYLTILYTSDSAKNISMDQIAQTMEQDSAIVSLNQETRTDLKHYYQTDDRDIDGYFFYKAASPMAVEEICIMKANDNDQAADLPDNYIRFCDFHTSATEPACTAPHLLSGFPEPLPLHFPRCS